MSGHGVGFVEAVCVCCHGMVHGSSGVAGDPMLMLMPETESLGDVVTKRGSSHECIFWLLS